MGKKTDNHDPRAKLELRRYFLRKFHADNPPDVLDCCQGGGLLWRDLRKEFELRSYWGVDLKPKKGRLKLDSVRILAQPGWPQNVVDIDTYGSPWKHWEAMLPNVARSITVFFTIGQGQGKAMTMPSHIELESIGITRFLGFSRDHSRYSEPTVNGHPIPRPILGKVAQIAASYVLAKTCDYGIMLTEAVEVVKAASNQSARYIGVRLEPASDNARAIIPGASKHPQLSGVTEHV